MRNSRLLKLLSVIFVVVLFAFIITRIGQKKANVSLTLSPSVADVVVDNTKKVEQGKFYLAPGSHKLSVTMGGFAEKSVNFDVTKGQVTTLSVILLPNSRVGFDWLKNHPEEAARREGLGGKEFEQTGNAVASKLPLVDELPFIDQFFRVDYGPSIAHPDDSSAVALYIKYYSPEGKQQALAWLKFKGYDPSKLEIIYQDAIERQLE
jgi:hypothetical protein